MNLQQMSWGRLYANMNLTGLVYLTCLVVIQCGSASFVLRLESTVRVQPGLATSLECHVQQEGRLAIFWMKIPLNKAPVCIATAKGFAEVAMCEQFKNHSRIKVTWNKKTFNLSFSSVEQTDIATYFCGMYNYPDLFFGNGSKLILEGHADTPVKDNEEKGRKMPVLLYFIPALAATNVASIFIIVWLLLRKNRSEGVTAKDEDAGDKTDEVNYAALNFRNKQNRTAQKRTNVDAAVTYGAVRH